MNGLSSDGEVEAAVLRYLTDRPDAMDTLCGISDWWLARERVLSDAGQVATVLQRLVERDVLERLGVGESTLYRLRTR